MTIITKAGDRLNSGDLNGILNIVKDNYIGETSNSIHFNNGQGGLLFYAPTHIDLSGNKSAEIMLTLETVVTVYYRGNTVLTTHNTPLTDDWTKVRLNRISHSSNANFWATVKSITKNYDASAPEVNGAVIASYSYGDVRAIQYYQHRTLVLEVPKNRIDNNALYRVLRLTDSSNNNIFIYDKQFTRITSIIHDWDRHKLTLPLPVLRNYTEYTGYNLLWESGIFADYLRKAKHAIFNIRSPKGNILNNTLGKTFFKRYGVNRSRFLLVYKDKYSDTASNLSLVGFNTNYTQDILLYNSGWSSYYLHRVYLEIDHDYLYHSDLEPQVNFYNRVYGMAMILSNNQHKYSDPTDVNTFPKVIDANALQGKRAFTNHLFALMVDSVMCPSADIGATNLTVDSHLNANGDEYNYLHFVNQGGDVDILYTKTGAYNDNNTSVNPQVYPEGSTPTEEDFSWNVKTLNGIPAYDTPDDDEYNGVDNWGQGD